VTNAFGEPSRTGTSKLSTIKRKAEVLKGRLEKKRLRWSRIVGKQWVAVKLEKMETLLDQFITVALELQRNGVE